MTSTYAVRRKKENKATHSIRKFLFTLLGKMTDSAIAEAFCKRDHSSTSSYDR
jgi:hypothetical protein